MVRAIFAAQAQAKAAAAPAAASTVAQLHDAAHSEHAELFEDLTTATLAGVVTVAPRRTCKKDMLPQMCGRCSNPRSKGACAYKTGEWTPPGANGTTAEPQPQTAEVVTDAGAPRVQLEQRRLRKKTDFFRAGRPVLAARAARHCKASLSKQLEYELQRNGSRDG